MVVDTVPVVTVGEAPAPGDLRVARVARRYLKTKPRLKRNDCSGLVITVLGELGVRVVGGTRQMWARARREGRVARRPLPGDLAFFDHTYDKNRNGRVDDPLSHVAIVVAVDGDQVEMVHKVRSGIRRLRVNLATPDVFKADGEVKNDFLRQPGYGPRRGKRLAGQLLRGFARPPIPKRVALR